MEDNQILEPKVASYSEEQPKQEVVNPTPSVVTKAKKKEKTPKSKIMKAAIAVFVISIITGIGALFCVVSPILFGLLLVVYFAAVLVITICTLGLLWTEEANRQGVGEVYNAIMDMANYIAAILTVGMVLGIIAILTTITSIILSSVAVAKKHKGALPILIISSIIFTVVVVLVFVAIYNMQSNGAA